MLRFLRSIELTVDAFMATVESIALSVVSRIATWSAPIPSAVAVTRSVMHTLELPIEVGVFVAITLEVFGIAAAHQWLEAKEWNATKKAREPAAEERIGRGATIAYVVIAEVMICTMELRTILETGQPWGLGALVFPPMTLIIVLVANERMMQHQRRMDRMEARANSANGDYGMFCQAMANGGRAMTIEDLSAHLGKSERTISRWKVKWHDERQANHEPL